MKTGDVVMLNSQLYSRDFSESRGPGIVVDYFFLDSGETGMYAVKWQASRGLVLQYQPNELMLVNNKASHKVKPAPGLPVL